MLASTVAIELQGSQDSHHANQIIGGLVGASVFLEFEPIDFDRLDLQAFVWDLLSNIGSDFKLLSHYKLTLPMIVYFVSRLTVLAHILFAAIYQTASLQLLDARTPGGVVFRGAICALYSAAFSSTSFLFVLRVQAIFNNDRYIVGFFFPLWFIGLFGSTTTAILTCVMRPGSVNLSALFDTYTWVAPISMTLTDTCAFFAISWRLLQHQESDRKRNFKTAITGEYLPAFTRSLLREGQIYYLLTVTTNVTLATITAIHGTSQPFRMVCNLWSVGLTNMLACRLYRNTKFGKFKEDDISSTWVASRLRRFDVEIDRVPSPITFTTQHTSSILNDPSDAHIQPCRD